MDKQPTNPRRPLSLPLRLMMVSAAGLFVAPLGLIFDSPNWAILAWALLWFVVILGASFVMMREAFSRPRKPKA
ncbi:MAG: hypothetical protein KDB07_06745 [Planctomycetes bacterium]|nr:hypothetical protein [Planctomycetota bacterium]